MQAVTTIGLDIAKSVFQAHGIGAANMRQTTSASTSPVLGAYRTFVRPPATSQFDPNRTFRPSP
jgi:hypothetical protein